MSRKDSKGRVLQKGESERLSNGKHLGYVYRYKDACGVSQQIYAKSLMELRKKEKQATKDDAQGIKRDGRKLTVAQVYEMWLQSRRGDVAAGTLRKSTLDNYVYVWSVYVKGTKFTQAKIASVTVTHIQDLYKQLLMQGFSIGTCETVHTVMSGVFKYASAQGYCKTNTARGAITKISKSIRNIKKASGADAPRCLTKEQRALFLEILEKPKYKHYAPILRLMLHTGLRIGELCGLSTDDITEDTISVCRCLKHSVDENGKMRKFINPPKSASSRRCISISKAAKADLSDWNALNVFCIDSVDNVSNLAFCTPKGRPLTASAVNLIIKRIVADAEGGLPANFSSHFLRHTFCCDAIDQGVPLAVVSSYMGHETTEITMRVYYDCRPSVMAEGLSILDTIDDPDSKQNGKQKAA